MPDALEPGGAARVSRVFHALLRNGRGRGTTALGIFALVLFSAGRRAPDAADAPAVPRGPDALAASRVLERSAPPAGGAPGSHLPVATPEAVAVDNLLARYDALIRLLEARSIGGRGSPGDSALAELRSLRARTFAAVRSAVTATERPPDW
jgi:hypothetical protein